MNDKKNFDESDTRDGRDFENIATLIQKIFIEGNDPLKSARQKVFDDILNRRVTKAKRSVGLLRMSDAPTEQDY